MRSRLRQYIMYVRILLITMIWCGAVIPVSAQSTANLGACDEFAYSTEEDFITQGPLPADGNPLISDGDLLSRNGALCARNWQLLQKWEIKADLGLDAADLLFVDGGMVIFSTELDDPQGRFTEGDLLTTNGAIIPNQALLTSFQVGYNLGLDGLHLVGDVKDIDTFLKVAADTEPKEWLNGKILPAWLERYGIDIWFSVEGTELRAAAVPIYDGDLLSARDGIVVLRQDQLLPASVPAGIPNRGVDFGLDGITGARKPDRSSMRFSTELLYRKDPAFTDGDILRVGNGVEIPHHTIIAPFEPKARFQGVDALYMYVPNDGDTLGGNGNPRGDDSAESTLFIPLVNR
ncbi:MAG: hypothetical protein R2932_14725 [Caldilineaceae bacterium]